MDCKCTKEREIGILDDNQRRILPIIDGNGRRKPLEVRINELEIMTEQTTKTLENLNECSTLLKQNVSAMMKVNEEKILTKREQREISQQRFMNIIKVIGIILVVAGLVYDIFFNHAA